MSPDHPGQVIRGTHLGELASELSGRDIVVVLAALDAPAREILRRGALDQVSVAPTLDQAVHVGGRAGVA